MSNISLTSIRVSHRLHLHVRPQAMATFCWAALLVLATQAHAAPMEHEHETTAHVQWKGPDQRVSMTLQIGENRIYRFDNRSGPNLVDLGHLEQGWTTFRLSQVSLFAPPKRAGLPAELVQSGLSCSGGFAVDRDHTLKLSLRSGTQGLQCELQAVPSRPTGHRPGGKTITR